MSVFPRAKSIVAWFLTRDKWWLRSKLELFVSISGLSNIELSGPVNIRTFSHLNVHPREDRKALKIGSGVYIGRFCQINAYHDVVIGNQVLISDRVYISDATHEIENKSIPIKLQPTSFAGAVRIGAGCWVGIGVVILPGVTIGEQTVIAANSVVTADCKSRAVYAGVPAKLVRNL